jgi:dTDP-4-amino-4,6-dideoxygalactose transaminase
VLNSIQLFEIEIAKFFGSPYAVTTDCCTHAVELCLRLKHIKTATSPTRTYLSIPMTLEKLGINWSWQDINWQDYYYIGSTNIIDAAVYWKANGYVPNTLMCLSFQFQKHLNLGRGGAILCETLEDYTELKKMTHDGRLPGVPWKDQNVDAWGYHYYMTLETADLGLEKLPKAIETAPKIWTQDEYPYLPNMKVFQQ